MDLEKKNKIIQILIAIFLIIWAISMWQTFQGGGPNPNETVPLLSLPVTIHMRIFFIIWPICGTLILVIVFSRMAPLIYMKSKRLMLPKYENGYIETLRQKFTFKKYFGRCIYCFLLSVGIMTALVGAGIFDLNLLASEELNASAEKIDLPIQYTFYGFFEAIFFFFPLAAGILSVGWAIEDAGLIHYNLPESKKDELFEIEPIYVRYNSYIKGYAGFSSFFYFLSAVWFILVIRIDLLKTPEGWLFLFYPMALLMGLFILFPAYFVYLRISPNFLRKKVPKRSSITKQEYTS